MGSVQTVDVVALREGAPVAGDQGEGLTLVPAPPSRAFGLAEGSQIRIGLNAGPVFRGFDAVIGRDNYYGASVTRAARIEPVTPPGTVFASEAFAATLAATGSRGFLLEYVGRVGLAKSYGEARVYRLDSR